MPPLNIPRAIQLNKKWAKQLAWDRTEVIVFVLSDKLAAQQLMNGPNVFAQLTKGPSMGARNSHSRVPIAQADADQNFVHSVAEWQAVNGLTGKNADGVIGPKTLAKMLKNKKFKDTHFVRLNGFCSINHLPTIPNSSKQGKTFGQQTIYFNNSLAQLNNTAVFFEKATKLLKEVLNTDLFVDIYSSLLLIVSDGDLHKVSKLQLYTIFVQHKLMKKMEWLAAKLNRFSSSFSAKSPKLLKGMKVPIFDAMAIVEVFWEVITGKWNTHSILNFWLAATGIVTAAAAAGLIASGSVILLAIGGVLIALYGIYNFLYDSDAMLDAALPLNKRINKGFKTY